MLVSERLLQLPLRRALRFKGIDLRARLEERCLA
jgi:hypothetical protein